jgi:hypothetical protein
MVLPKLVARCGLRARREDVEFPRPGDPRDPEHLGGRSALCRHGGCLGIGPHRIAGGHPGLARDVAVAA